MTASTLRVGREQDDWTPNDPGSLAERLSNLLSKDGDDDNVIVFTPAPSIIANPRQPRRATPTPAEMQAMIEDFRKRQRQASVVVAVSLATACLLTLGGIVAASMMARPNQPISRDPQLPRTTSLAWQPPHGTAAIAAEPIVFSNRELKGEPLLVSAKTASPSEASAAFMDASLRDNPNPNATVLLATPERPLALAPLLPRRHARYLLLRGLPDAAQLSKGQRNASGAWMVDNDDVAGLTLTVGATASGDYPLELYLLGDGTAPQARQSLMLRLVAEQAAATPDISWPAALLDMAMMTLTPEDKAVLRQLSALRARADQLLAEGDIASARLILRHLADSGAEDAALALARSFDPQGLAELGVRGMQGDRRQAAAWFARAAEIGNAEATQRSKILASLAE